MWCPYFRGVLISEVSSFQGVLISEVSSFQDVLISEVSYAFQDVLIGELTYRHNDVHYIPLCQGGRSEECLNLPCHASVHASISCAEHTKCRVLPNPLIVLAPQMLYINILLVHVK